MKYYGYVDIPNWESTANTILNYVLNESGIERESNHFTLMDVEIIKDRCPEFVNWLKSIDNDIDLAAIVYTNHSRCGIHTDLSFNNADTYRLNIPLLNCENTYTVFYTDCPPITPMISENGMPYGQMDMELAYKTAKEIDRLSLTKPAFLKVVDPHDVICKNSVLPRIALTLRFIKPVDDLVNY